MAYVEVEVEYDLDDAWRYLSEDEKLGSIKDWLDDGYVPDGWSRALKLEIETDPVYRLQIIEWLRANGWTVEPIG